MYASLVKPQKLEPLELDQFLEKGWFRLGRSLFTTSFLTFQDHVFNALWLRINLLNFTPNKKQTILLNKSAEFVVKIGAFELTEEKSVLFQKYRYSLAFEPARFLESILMSDEGEEIFNTYDVCIYKENKLIACGIFDLGFLSAEGIVSFFDPEYKKYSLGKLLVLHKLQYCKDQGFHWFYPGYIAPGHKRFDYKLDIAKENSEYFDLSEDRWQHIDALESAIFPLETMRSALINLETIIHSFGFEEFKFKKYRFYDIGLDNGYSDYSLLTYPYMVHCFSNSQLEEVLIVYNTFISKYQLLICHKIFQITMPYNEDYFSEYLIRQSKVVLEESNVLNFVFGLQELLRRNPQADMEEN